MPLTYLEEAVDTQQQAIKPGAGELWERRDVIWS